MNSLKGIYSRPKGSLMQVALLLCAPTMGTYSGYGGGNGAAAQAVQQRGREGGTKGTDPKRTQAHAPLLSRRELSSAAHPGTRVLP